MQGAYLNTLVYNSSQLGAKSCEQLIELLPHLCEIQLVNLSGASLKLTLEKLLDAIIAKGQCLQNLKLSNMNLNSSAIVKKLCKIIDSKELVATLDLSWGRLSA